MPSVETGHVFLLKLPKTDVVPVLSANSEYNCPFSVGLCFFSCFTPLHHSLLTYDILSFRVSYQITSYLSCTKVLCSSKFLIGSLNLRSFIANACSQTAIICNLFHSGGYRQYYLLLVRFTIRNSRG